MIARHSWLLPAFLLGIVLSACNGDSAGRCGDGRMGGLEECDGLDLAGQSCESLALGQGTLKCAPDCTFDRGTCSAGAICGNGVREGMELCDGGDLGGTTCELLNLGTGTLGCDAACEFDDVGCSLAPVCGNGIVEGGEQCDGPNLGGATCRAIDPGFEGGVLTCTGCAFDTSACSTSASCGNRLIEAGETCDTTNLGGLTCQSLGHAGGLLVCAPNCSLDDSGCGSVAEDCGNTVDDDGDGDIDCADSDCLALPGCGGSPEICNDGLENDGDNLIDCDDPDCAMDPSCFTPGDEVCDDGIDNDLDGDCDCVDSNCSLNLNCILTLFTPELFCNDGIDEDFDCLVDCADPDCDGAPACQGPACENATPVSCGANVSGDTTGQGTQLQSYGCPGTATGPEVVYSFSAGSSGQVTVNLVGSGPADLDLFVIGGGAGGACDAEGQCITAGLNTGGTESVNFSASAGGLYYIVVDGYNGADGPFDLAVICN